jgi:hypothetical protein
VIAVVDDGSDVNEGRPTALLNMYLLKMVMTDMMNDRLMLYPIVVAVAVVFSLTTMAIARVFPSNKILWVLVLIIIDHSNGPSSFL